MATINDQTTVDDIIKNDGWYENDHDEPRVLKIVQYQNAFNGGDAFGLIFEDEPLNKYDPSDFIISPKVLWECDFLKW